MYYNFLIMNIARRDRLGTIIMCYTYSGRLNFNSAQSQQLRTCAIIAHSVYFTTPYDALFNTYENQSIVLQCHTLVPITLFLAESFDYVPFAALNDIVSLLLFCRAGNTCFRNRVFFFFLSKIISRLPYSDLS